MPTGLGIGATQVTWEVMSFTRAAGKLVINTVADPLAIIPGPAGTHPGSMQGVLMSVTRAAANPPISTVGAPVIIVSGRAGCGTGTIG